MNMGLSILPLTNTHSLPTRPNYRRQVIKLLTALITRSSRNTMDTWRTNGRDFDSSFVSDAIKENLIYISMSSEVRKRNPEAKSLR